MTIATNKQDLSITENKITGIEGTENAKENASSGFKLTLVSKYISFHLAWAWTLSAQRQAKSHPEHGLWQQ